MFLSTYRHIAPRYEPLNTKIMTLKYLVEPKSPNAENSYLCGAPYRKVDFCTVNVMDMLTKKYIYWLETRGKVESDIVMLLYIDVKVDGT